MYYNLAHGGDINVGNAGTSMYPQNVHVDPVNKARTLLRPAEHKSPATYNIWRNLNFRDTMHGTNKGLMEYVREVYAENGGFKADDIIGVVALPHEALLQGLYWRVEAPQEGTVIQLVRVSDGSDIGDPIDASAIGNGFEDETFLVPIDNNEVIGIKVVSWPDPSEDNPDPCGVYGPCSELTLCFTLNAFIWSPVAEHFCTDDPCFGVRTSGSPAVDY